MRIKYYFQLLVLFMLGPLAAASALSQDDIAAYYRDLTLKIRPVGKFYVPIPNKDESTFSYQIKFGKPHFKEPIYSVFHLNEKEHPFFRFFGDKIFLEDGSTLFLGDKKVPLTCVFVDGQDNRFSKKELPLIPDIILKVYLVANDFTCTGPLNPGWPMNGSKKETWDTYLYYEVRDPTIMLPTEIKIRYRGNEFLGVLVDEGKNQ